MKTSSLTIAAIDEAAMRFGTLVGHPERQAEAIIHHYAAHASMAIDVFRVMEKYRGLHPQDHPDHYRDYINHAVYLIRRGHLADFGIPLEWEAKP